MVLNVCGRVALMLALCLQTSSQETFDTRKDYFRLCTELVTFEWYTHKACSSRAGTNLADLKNVVHGERTTMHFDMPCFSSPILISYGLRC